MANRWERGKLGPYTLPQDFKEGGVALNGINNVKPKEDSFLVPPATLVYFNDPELITDESNVVCPSGQALSRSSYSSLFDVVGTQFGVGDGSTTFDLPNLQYTAGRAFGTSAASGIGEFQVGTMWDHTHSVERLTGSNNAKYEPLTFPQPIEKENAITNPNAGPVIQFATTQTATAFNVPNPQITPIFGPTETRYQNPKGIFAGRTYKMFPAWVTKPAAIPIGSIVPFIGNDDLSPYEGYLLCNGQSVDPALYPSAAALGVTTTPDLRGYFISGILEEEARVATNTIGAAHRHRYTATPSEGFVGANPLITAGTFNVQIGGPFQSSPSYYIQSTRATGSSSLGPGNETRPVNISVTYLIRVA